MPAASPPARWPRLRLLTALAAPSGLGALGMFHFESIAVTFYLYLLGGCLLVPCLLLGARPLHGRGGLPFQPPPARRQARLEITLAAVFGPVFLAVYLFVRPWLGDIADYQARVAALGLDPAAPLVPFVLFVALNPLLEEWWWRGQATLRCRETFGDRRGLALATAGFGFYHVVLLAALFPWSMALVRAGFIAATGLLWSHLAMRLGSWRAVYFAHLAADLSMVVVFILVVMHRQ